MGKVSQPNLDVWKLLGYSTPPSREEWDAELRRRHPELFEVPTPEERARRRRIAEAAQGSLSQEEYEALMRKIEEGK